LVTQPMTGPVQGRLFQYVQNTTMVQAHTHGANQTTPRGFVTVSCAQTQHNEIDPWDHTDTPTNCAGMYTTRKTQLTVALPSENRKVDGSIPFLATFLQHITLTNGAFQISIKALGQLRCV